MKTERPGNPGQLGAENSSTAPFVNHGDAPYVGGKSARRLWPSARSIR